MELIMELVGREFIYGRIIIIRYFLTGKKLGWHMINNLFTDKIAATS